MEVEKTLDNLKVDEEPVVMRHLVITTEDLAKQYCLTHLAKAPLSQLLFVSCAFSDKFRIPIRGTVTSYVGVKQFNQYSWLRHMLIDRFIIMPEIYGLCVVFEQTKHGSVHFHMLLNTTIHKHDIRASLAELFNIKRATEIILSINVKAVTDVDKLLEYLFNKTTKAYEKLDMKTYKPLILK